MGIYAKMQPLDRKFILNMLINIYFSISNTFSFKLLLGLPWFEVSDVLLIFISTLSIFLQVCLIVEENRSYYSKQSTLSCSQLCTLLKSTLISCERWYISDSQTILFILKIQNIHNLGCEIAFLSFVTSNAMCWMWNLVTALHELVMFPVSVSRSSTFLKFIIFWIL